MNEDLLKEILKYLGLNNWLKFAGVIAGLIAILIALFKIIFSAIAKFKNKAKQKKLEKDLHPFYSKYDVKKATENYIQTNCQNISPSKEDEPQRTHAFAVKQRIIPFFLNNAFKDDKDDCRFYIILADSGMGKTTFMINLYHSYINQVFGKKYKIKLLPLGYPKIDDEIKSIEDKKNTILLLDAFDEDNRAASEYKVRFKELIDLIAPFREIVITCRTQFFPTEDEEPKETGVFRYGSDKSEYLFRKLYISPFDNKDIENYLKKKYSLFHIKKRKKAYKIVQLSPNLMVRPMLLSYIDDLLESSSNYNYTFQIYEELIKKWIERESKRVDSNRRQSFEKELYLFTKQIASDIYINRNIRNGLFFEIKDFTAFADKFSIKLSDWEMSGRSLLNRNAQGLFKFSHKSILEYFLAKKVYEEEDFAISFSWEGMEQAERFFSELCLVDLINIRDTSTLKNINIDYLLKKMNPSISSLLTIIAILLKSTLAPSSEISLTSLTKNTYKLILKMQDTELVFEMKGDLINEKIPELDDIKKNTLTIASSKFNLGIIQGVLPLIKLKGKIELVKGAKIKTSNDLIEILNKYDTHNIS